MDKPVGQMHQADYTIKTDMVGTISCFYRTPQRSVCGYNWWSV